MGIVTSIFYLPNGIAFRKVSGSFLICKTKPILLSMLFQALAFFAHIGVAIPTKANGLLTAILTWCRFGMGLNNVFV